MVVLFLGVGDVYLRYTAFKYPVGKISKRQKNQTQSPTIKPTLVLSVFCCGYKLEILSLMHSHTFIKCLRAVILKQKGFSPSDCWHTERQSVNLLSSDTVVSEFSLCLIHHR